MSIIISTGEKYEVVDEYFLLGYYYFLPELSSVTLMKSQGISTGFLNYLLCRPSLLISVIQCDVLFLKNVTFSPLIQESQYRFHLS